MRLAFRCKLVLKLAVLFLLELYAVTKDQQYQRAAKLQRKRFNQQSIVTKYGMMSLPYMSILLLYALINITGILYCK